MHHLPPTASTYASLIKECCTTKNLGYLRQLHAQTIKVCLSSDDFIRAKLVSAYSSCSQMSDAHFIFSLSNRHFTFMFNTLIQGYASIKSFHLSLSCFQHMLSCRTEINRFTLPAVFKSVAALSLLPVGKRVHGYALVNGFGSDLAHRNALVSMYGKCGDLCSARKVFDDMPEVNVITWGGLLSGYCSQGMFDEVFEFFDTGLSSGWQPDAVLFTAVLTACSRRGGMVEQGKEVFQMMTETFGIRPSREQCTCMVDLLGKAGRIEEAKEFIENMDFEPDKILWRAFLGTCRLHGVLEITVRGHYFDLRSIRLTD